MLSWHLSKAASNFDVIKSFLLFFVVIEDYELWDNTDGGCDGSAWLTSVFDKLLPIFER